MYIMDYADIILLRFMEISIRLKRVNETIVAEKATYFGFSYLYFKFYGCWMVFFIFLSNSYRPFCEQTVEIMIRRRRTRRLIWVCTVCLCPTKRTLGLYGLKRLDLQL